jgi:putative Mg2+ transporter-C (MgtC) family protein
MGNWWQNLWDMLGEEFGDLPRFAEVVRIGLRLTLAAVFGGVLGYEREQTGKSAGVRTHMLVALGAAFFALVPSLLGASGEALSRVIQGIATGIGFIGGGTILKQNEQGVIKGLTTAAGIWMTAALGVAAGTGRLASAALGTVLALIILAALPLLIKHSDDH